MSDCQNCRERLLESLYGELGQADQARLEKHLAACPACAAERAGLEETLGLMSRRRRPDPGPEFWDGYWDRLSRRMVWEAAGEARRPSLAARLGALVPRLPRWSYQAAGAAALILLGVLIGGRLARIGGRSDMAAAARPAGPAAATATPSTAVVEAGQFIERSKVLLLGLVNFDPATEDPYALDLDGKKAVSRRLLAQAPAIREGLGGPGERRLRELVADLELIMLQIANLESGQDLAGVELVRQGIDRKGLFLKIDLDRLSREPETTRPSGHRRPAGPSTKSTI